MGRVLVGILAGLLFGLGVALTLQQYGVRPLDTLSLVGIPLLGVLLGVVLAFWRPFGRSRHDPDAT